MYSRVLAGCTCYYHFLVQSPLPSALTTEVRFYRKMHGADEPPVSLQPFGIFAWSPFNLKGEREGGRERDEGKGWGQVREAATRFTSCPAPRCCLEFRRKEKKTKKSDICQKPITSPFLG